MFVFKGPTVGQGMNAANAGVQVQPRGYMLSSISYHLECSDLLNPSRTFSPSEHRPPPPFALP